MKKIGAALLAATMCLGLLTGCGGNAGNDTPTGNTNNQEQVASGTSTKLTEPPAIEQMLADVADFPYSVLPENAKISSGEIVKRQSNPDDKEDIVFLRLIGQENSYMYSQYFVKLLYNFYDEGGWILDEMTADQVENWGAAGYLDGEGRPLEEGMLYIGRDILPSEGDSEGASGGAPSDEGPEPEEYQYKAPRIGKKDAAIVINDQGMWHSYGVVSDMNGTVVDGIVDTSNANRTFAYEDGLVYLCDMDGNKLSSGYLEVTYAGAVKDENNNIVDHRWRVCKDNMIGFLNDAGEEILKPTVYSIEGNERATFMNDEGTSGNICVLKQGQYKCVISNQHGQELHRIDTDSNKYYEITSNGFVVIGERNADYAYEVSAFNADGHCFVDRAYYYDICVGENGLALRRAYGDGWDLYDWSGNRTNFRDQNDDISSMHHLQGLYYYANYDSQQCLYKRTGDYAHSSHVRIADWLQYYCTYETVTTFDGTVYSLDGDVIISGYERVEPIAGGLYIVTNSEGKDALFDINGNQRTQFFEDIMTCSENGQYFIVQMDSKLYAMRTPLTQAELDTAPAFHAFNCIL